MAGYWENSLGMVPSPAPKEKSDCSQYHLEITNTTLAPDGFSRLVMWVALNRGKMGNWLTSFIGLSMGNTQDRLFMQVSHPG